MSTPKAPNLAVLPIADEAARPQILQPSGWPLPKGYANGMAADGRIVRDRRRDRLEHPWSFAA